MVGTGNLIFKGGGLAAFPNTDARLPIGFELLPNSNWNWNWTLAQVVPCFLNWKNKSECKLGPGSVRVRKHWLFVNNLNSGVIWTVLERQRKMDDIVHITPVVNRREWNSWDGRYRRDDQFTGISWVWVSCRNVCREAAAGTYVVDRNTLDAVVRVCWKIVSGIRRKGWGLNRRWGFCSWSGDGLRGWDWEYARSKSTFSD